MLRELKDRLFLLYLLASALLILMTLGNILYSVVANGAPVLLSRGFEFFTETLPAPNKPGGGIFPAIYGTFLMVFLASLIGIPMAVLAGVFVAEYPNSLLGRATRSLLLTMLEFPTILVGLFVMHSWSSGSGNCHAPLRRNLYGAGDEEC